MAKNGRLLSTDLAGQIRIDILSEKMRPGEKLTESALCERYGVSRTPVREALKNLGSEGLIETIPNRGAFVVGMSKDNIRDLCILRMQNEIQAVRWAIERRTNAEMEALEESLDFMRFYTERSDIKRMRSINADFHRRIAMASRNRVLFDTLMRIQDYIRYSSRVIPYREESLNVILNEHLSVFKAFETNDPDSGAAVMEKHITNSFSRANI